MLKLTQSIVTTFKSHSDLKQAFAILAEAGYSYSESYNLYQQYMEQSS